MKLLKNRIELFALILLVLLSSVSTVLASGGKIAGKVIDSETNQPIPGVNVIIPDLQIGGATDIDGDYFILNIPPGTYTLRASMVGFTPVVYENVEVSLNHTTTVDFEMSTEVLELGEEVVVMAERAPVS